MYKSMREHIERALQENPFNGLTLQTAALLGMRTIELYSAQQDNGNSLSGEEKREMCHAVIPMVIDLAYQTGRIMLSTKLDLDSQYEEGPTIVDDLLSVAAFVSKQPEFIQLAHHVAEEAVEAASRCAQRLCSKNGDDPQKRRRRKKRARLSQQHEARVTVPVQQAQAAALPNV